MSLNTIHKRLMNALRYSGYISGFDTDNTYVFANYTSFFLMRQFINEGLICSVVTKEVYYESGITYHFQLTDRFMTLLEFDKL